jgi:hypothetical protein
LARGAATRWRAAAFSAEVASTLSIDESWLDAIDAANAEFCGFARRHSGLAATSPIGIFASLKKTPEQAALDPAELVETNSPAEISRQQGRVDQIGAIEGGASGTSIPSRLACRYETWLNPPPRSSASSGCESLRFVIRRELRSDDAPYRCKRILLRERANEQAEKDHDQNGSQQRLQNPLDKRPTRCVPISFYPFYPFSGAPAPERIGRSSRSRACATRQHARPASPRHDIRRTRPCATLDPSANIFARVAHGGPVE